MNSRPRDMDLLKTKYPFLDSFSSCCRGIVSIILFLYMSSEAVYNTVTRFFLGFVGFSRFGVSFSICFLLIFLCLFQIDFVCLSLEVFHISCLFRIYNNFHFLQEISPSHLHILLMNFHSHPRSTNFCNDQENTQTLQTALSKKIEIYHDKISEVIHVWEQRCSSQWTTSALSNCNV